MEPNFTALRVFLACQFPCHPVFSVLRFGDAINAYVYQGRCAYQGKYPRDDALHDLEAISQPDGRNKTRQCI